MQSRRSCTADLLISVVPRLISSSARGRKQAPPEVKPCLMNNIFPSTIIPAVFYTSVYTHNNIQIEASSMPVLVVNKRYGTTFVVMYLNNE